MIPRGVMLGKPLGLYAWCPRPPLVGWATFHGSPMVWWRWGEVIVM